MTPETQIVLQTLMDVWMVFCFCFIAAFVKHHITIGKKNK